MTTAERYFKFLETQYVEEDGTRRQPAPGRFVQHLREVHAQQKPRYDLSACLAGTQPRFTGRVWCWSDLHFFHTNIIKYCGRPFGTAEEMNNALLKNCLERVGPNDILLIGGDITMSNIEGTNALLSAIPAYKINVLGNHDTHKHQLLKLAVDETVACLELTVQDRSIFVSHYPVSESVLSPNQVNLHGHIHNNGLPAALGDGARHINMSVELTRYSPLLLVTLLSENLSGELKESQ
jgi:calcineurin-like phosphoesterase family protein